MKKPKIIPGFYTVTEACGICERSEALIRIDIRSGKLKALALTTGGKGTYLIPCGNLSAYRQALIANKKAGK